MSRPEVLTNCSLQRAVILRQEIITHEHNPDGGGYVQLSVDFNMEFDNEKSMVEGDSFFVKASANVNAFFGDLENEQESDPLVATAKLEVLYHFIVTEDTSVISLSESDWAFELSLRPLLLTRLRDSIRNTPIENIPMDLF